MSTSEYSTLRHGENCHASVVASAVKHGAELLKQGQSSPTCNS